MSVGKKIKVNGQAYSKICLGRGHKCFVFYKHLLFPLQGPDMQVRFPGSHIKTYASPVQPTLLTPAFQKLMSETKAHNLGDGHTEPKGRTHLDFSSTTLGVGNTGVKINTDQLALGFWYCCSTREICFALAQLASTILKLKFCLHGADLIVAT